MVQLYNSHFFLCELWTWWLGLTWPPLVPLPSLWSPHHGGWSPYGTFQLKTPGRPLVLVSVKRFHQWPSLGLFTWFVWQRSFILSCWKKNAISMCVKMKVYHSSEFTLYTDPTLTWQSSEIRRCVRGFCMILGDDVWWNEQSQSLKAIHLPPAILYW